MDARKYQHIKVLPLANACGAEIHGVGAVQDLDDATVAEIRQAWLDHHVIFFRDQDLAPEQQLAFAARFGQIDRYPMVPGMQDFPDVVEVVKLAHETKNFGGEWHFDTIYLATPALGATLFAVELPEIGGDTMWASMAAAYDALSDGMKDLLSGLLVINRSDKAAVNLGRANRLKDAPPSARKGPFESLHPVVRTHPESGRKTLFCSKSHSIRFKGMSEAESAPILSYLYDHQARPEFSCRFRWREGDLAFWDNRACIHNPINDYHGQKRLMRRVSLKGDVPV